MRKIILIAFIVIGLMYSSLSCQAQASPTEMADATDNGGPALKLGINYLSNSVFVGRADTVKTPTLTPFLKYKFQNGIYLSGDVEVVTNRKKGKLDGGSLGAGYDFEIGDNIDGSVSFTKLFFNTNSTQIGSGITGTFNANLNYDIEGIITTTAGLDYNLVKKGFGNDVLLNLGISHEFSVGAQDEDGQFTVAPSAEVNSGTQNFYDAILTVKKRRRFATAVSAAQKAALGRFTVLDYEFSMPVEFKPGHFIFTFNPTYAIAKNQVPIRTVVINPAGLFYFEIGVALKL
jgi:hypothetical protein